LRSALLAAGDARKRSAVAQSNNSDQVAEDSFYSNLAINIIKKAGSLGHENKAELLCKFGTDRIVVLLGGQDFITS